MYLLNKVYKTDFVKNGLKQWFSNFQTNITHLRHFEKSNYPCNIFNDRVLCFSKNFGKNCRKILKKIMKKFQKNCGKCFWKNSTIFPEIFFHSFSKKISSIFWEIFSTIFYKNSFFQTFLHNLFLNFSATFFPIFPQFVLIFPIYFKNFSNFVFYV